AAGTPWSGGMQLDQAAGAMAGMTGGLTGGAPPGASMKAMAPGFQPVGGAPQPGMTGAPINPATMPGMAGGNMASMVQAQQNPAALRGGPQPAGMTPQAKQLAGLR